MSLCHIQSKTEALGIEKIRLIGKLIKTEPLKTTKQKQHFRMNKELDRVEWNGSQFN